MVDCLDRLTDGARRFVHLPLGRKFGKGPSSGNDQCSGNAGHGSLGPGSPETEGDRYTVDTSLPDGKIQNFQGRFILAYVNLEVLPILQ